MLDGRKGVRYGRIWRSFFRQAPIFRDLLVREGAMGPAETCGMGASGSVPGARRQIGSGARLRSQARGLASLRGHCADAVAPSPRILPKARILPANPAPARRVARFIPFVQMFLWLIRVLRLIGGTGMHRINHEARINHNLSQTGFWSSCDWEDPGPV